MKGLGTILGAATAGIFVFGVWGRVVEAHGIFGGWLSGLVIIGTMWFLNHYVGIHNNEEGAAWVDMALGIGVAGTMNGVFRGLPLSAALPTLGYVAVGSILGGIAAAALNNYLAGKGKEEEKAEAEATK